MPPQVDQESSVTGGLETLAADDESENNNNPPESFYLSKEAEYEWFDRNSALFERKESTKGNTVVRSNSSTSQRFSFNLRKSKASIIGLPKAQKSTFVVDSKRKTTNVTLFPKRSDSAGKSRSLMVEPGSPKVSCMGRVRSKRCRRRSNSTKRREKENKSVERARSDSQKKGLYSRVMNMFRSKKETRTGSVKKGAEEPVRVKKNGSVNVDDKPAVEPPSLGGMNRFVSGRRTASWAGEEFS